MSGAATIEPRDNVATRSQLRAAALPSEHGGWGLTLEPVLLGLLVAPSAAAFALGIAALLAFLVRTPLKLVLVDRRRRRWLPRTRLATGVATAELTVIAALAVLAGRWAGWSWLFVAALTVPLVAVELWFDMRSRGRRLTPELCGAVGIGATAAAIAVAGGESGRLAAGLWLVIAARAIASIPFVRVQIERLRHGTASTAGAHAGHATGIAAAAAAAAVDSSVLAGAAAVAGLTAVQTVWLGRSPVPARTIGLRQMVLGLAVVAATAIGVLA